MSSLKIKAKHNNANYDIELPEEATMQDLCEKIFELTGIPLHGQKLICCGKQLPKDMTVHLREVWKLRERDPSIFFYPSKPLEF